MRKILCAILLTMMTIPVCSQSIKEKLEAKYGWACEHTSDGKKWYSVRKNGKEGACDAKGNEIVPPLYDDVLMRAGDGYVEAIKDKYTHIYSLQGKLIVKLPYEKVRLYQLKEYGYCEVTLNGKKGAIDSNGKERVPCKYDDIYEWELKEKGCCEVELDNKRGVVDIKGKELVPPIYDDITVYEDDNYIEAKLNKKTSIFGLTGKILAEYPYEDVSWHQIKEYGYCEVKLDNKRGVVDISGQELVPCKYDNIYDWELKEKGMCTVMIYGDKSEQGGTDSRLGVVNNKGQEILPTIYTSIVLLEGGFIVVGKGGSRYKDEYGAIGAKYAVYDINHKKFITEFKYDQIGYGSEGLFPYNIGAEAFYEGKKSIKFKGGKWGFLDTDGREVISAQYDEVTVFKDGVAQVTKNGVTSLLEHPLQGTNLKFAKGEGTAVDSKIPSTGKSNENVFAFIIANENYAHFSGADYSINDGKVFAEYCRKTLGLPEKNVRYYEDATYGNIMNAVKKLQDIADVYEGDAKIIFYYSGLGATADKNMEKYLLATDASLVALESTGYNVSNLLQTINNLNVEYSWVIVDAPFSNLDKSGKPLASGRGVALKSKSVNAEGKTIMSISSSDEQTAFSSKKYGHSLFTYGLLEKLQQTKGECSIKELNDYAASWVKKNSMTEFDKIQTPSCTASDSIINQLNNIKF